MIDLNLYDENQAKHKKIVANTENIIKWHVEGKNLKEIAEIMGVSHATIYYLLIKKGIIQKCRKVITPYSRKRKSEYEKKLKPFMERISPELRAMIKRNTEINDTRIKRPGSMRREEEKELVGSIAEMTITNVV